MEVYRLSRKKYSDVLSGLGAAKYGARWNSKGTEVVYTAMNRSLAMAEVVVHFNIFDLPKDYFMLTIYVPDNLTQQIVNVSQLPADWHSFPHPKVTQVIGDDFIAQGKYATLKVPSVVTKGDFNLILNPSNSLFHQIKIIDSTPFPFDRRIFI